MIASFWLHIICYEQNKKITQFNEQIKIRFCAAAVGEKRINQVQASKLFYDVCWIGWKTNKQNREFAPNIRTA